MKATKETGINELINDFPDVIPVLMAYGLHCVGCSFASNDTLGTGAKLHGFDEEKTEVMIKDVNKVLGKENDTKTNN